MASDSSSIAAVVREVADGVAHVEVEHGGCGRCHEPGGCGGQQLTQMFCNGPKTYCVDNPVGAVIGDRVLVAIAPGELRRTANLAYILPLTATIGGAALGMFLAEDIGAMIGGAAALFGAFLYIRRRMQRPAAQLAVRPYIVSRLS